MRAIILAAGRGMRLQQAEDQHAPKCLLSFDGTTLLERHLRILRKAGVEEIVLALGFRHDLIRHAIYSELPSPLRRSLHREAAATLSRTGASASRIAAHLAHGARPGDEEALRLLDEAAAALAPANPSAADARRRSSRPARRPS